MPSEPSKIPQMPAGILLDARAATAEGGGAIGGSAGFNPAANSAKDPSGFHSWEPSICTRVWALTRWSAIQRRISSAFTGPYCRPSAPTILYIMCLSGFNCGHESFGGWPGQSVIRGGTGPGSTGESALAWRNKLKLVTGDHNQAAPKQTSPRFPIPPDESGGTGSPSCWRETR